MSAPPIRRARLLAFAVLVLTFVAGALVGAASSRLLGADVPGAERREPHRRGPAAIFAPEGPMGERLQLSAEQREQVERILEADRQKAGAIFREVRPRLKARYDSTTAAIRAVLTPEQQRTFDRYQQERQARLRQRYERGDGERNAPPPPPPGARP